MTRHVDTVLFDLDDTLISWEHRQCSWRDYLRPVLQEMWVCVADQGLAVGDGGEFGRIFSETLKQAWVVARLTWQAPALRTVLHDTFAQMGIDVAALDLDAVMHAFTWQPMPGVTNFADTLPVLDHLRARGYRIGLLTNSFQPMWVRDHELAAFGLLDYFDARITSGDTGFIKPHPAIYWRLLGLLDRTPDRAVFVGDHPQYDIKGANLTGLTSVYLRRPYLERETNGVLPDYTIDTLTELRRVLEQLP